MTAIATILALLPMALGLSKAGVFIAGPLAIVVIGGLTSSTILTLLLVPTLYVIVEDIRGRFGKRRPTPPTPPHHPQAGMASNRGVQMTRIKSRGSNTRLHSSKNRLNRLCLFNPQVPN